MLVDEQEGSIGKQEVKLEGTNESHAVPCQDTIGMVRQMTRLRKECEKQYDEVQIQIEQLRDEMECRMKTQDKELESMKEQLRVMAEGKTKRRKTVIYHE